MTKRRGKMGPMAFTKGCSHQLENHSQQLKALRNQPEKQWLLYRVQLNNTKRPNLLKTATCATPAQRLNYFIEQIPTMIAFFLSNQLRTLGVVTSSVWDTLKWYFWKSFLLMKEQASSLLLFKFKWKLADSTGTSNLWVEYGRITQCCWPETC